MWRSQHYYGKNKLYLIVILFLKMHISNTSSWFKWTRLIMATATRASFKIRICSSFVSFEHPYFDGHVPLFTRKAVSSVWTALAEFETYDYFGGKYVYISSENRTLRLLSHHNDWYVILSLSALQLAPYLEGIVILYQIAVLWAMRSLNYVQRLSLDFTGTLFPHAICLGDADNDSVSWLTRNCFPLSHEPL